MDDPQAAQPASPSGEAAPFTRNATGLVRELSLLDMITYNASVATPLGAALAFGLFYVYAAFPGANLVVAFLLGLFGILFTIADLRTAKCRYAPHRW